MKKLLSLAFAVLFAATLVGCGGGDDPAKSDSVDNTPEVKAAYTLSWEAGKQWAAPTFIVEDDWVSLEVVFMTAPDTKSHQFCVISDKVEKEESWGTSYFSLYPAAAETTTIDIKDWLEVQANDAGKTLKDNGATKITKISIQNMTTDAKTIEVKSSKATKADGTVVDVKPEGDWGSKVL